MHEYKFNGLKYTKTKKNCAKFFIVVKSDWEKEYFVSRFLFLKNNQQK
jgi:hypothetical protein